MASYSFMNYYRNTFLLSSRLQNTRTEEQEAQREDDAEQQAESSNRRILDPKVIFCKKILNLFFFLHSTIPSFSRTHEFCNHSSACDYVLHKKVKRDILPPLFRYQK